MTFIEFVSAIEENPSLKTYSSKNLARKLDMEENEIKEFREWYKAKTPIGTPSSAIQTGGFIHKEILDSIPTIEELETTNYKVDPRLPDSIPGFSVSSFCKDKVWYKKEENVVIDNVNWKKEFKDGLKELRYINEDVVHDVPQNNLLVINALDVHLNKKYFQNPETLEQQVNTFIKAVKHIYNEAIKINPIDKVLFQLGHDFLNSEANGQTTKYTPQSNLEPAQVVFKEALKAVIYCTDFLSDKCQVDLINVNGNHDYYVTQQLFAALEVYYDNRKNVNIITGMQERFYYKWGNNSFMLIHDMKKKLAELPLVFSIESPEYFASTKNRFIISGHYHGVSQSQFLTSTEKYGIEHIQCPSLTGVDKWHSDNMYIGNKQRMLGLIIEKEKGLTNQIMFNK